MAWGIFRTTKYGNDDISKEYNEAYQHAESQWSPFYKEAKIDLRMFLGDQNDYSDKKYLVSDNRSPRSFNGMRRVIKMVGGYQKKNRLALKIDPIEQADSKTASQLSAATMWTMQYNNAYNILSKGFESGALITGINLINVYMDYSEDPVNGEIKFARVPYNEFRIDPNFTGVDLDQNCSFILRRKLLTKDALKCLLPGHGSEIDSFEPAGKRDNKFIDMPAWKDLLGQQMLRYDEYWKRVTNPTKILIDPTTGARMVWNKKRGPKRAMDDFISRVYEVTNGIELKVESGYEKSVELSVIVEENTLYSGEDPNGVNDFPFTPIIGLYEPEYDKMKDKLQALARCMRDPQIESNRRRMKILDIIDSQIGAGYLVEEGAVIDKDEPYKTGNHQVLWAKRGKISGIQKLEGARIDSGLFQIADLMDRDLMEIPGANADLLGLVEHSEANRAAILSKLRQGAALTILQDVFDDYRFSKKLIGRRVVKLIQENYTAKKIERIIGEQPTQEFQDKNFGKYDAVPTEGVLTDSQMQMSYLELKELKAGGAPIPWSAILAAAPLQEKEKLMKYVEAAEKSQAEQAKKAEEMEMITKAMMNAQVQTDMASVKAKDARAEEDRVDAMFDRIKMAAEIDKVGHEKIMDILGFIANMEKNKAVSPKQGAYVRR